MGWTRRQWAQAAAWHARVYGITPLPNLAGAGEVHRLWLLRVGLEPSDERLILVDEWSWHELGRPCIEENLAWASRLFRSAMLEVCNYGRRAT